MNEPSPSTLEIPLRAKNRRESHDAAGLYEADGGTQQHAGGGWTLVFDQPAVLRPDPGFAPNRVCTAKPNGL